MSQITDILVAAPSEATEICTAFGRVLKRWPHWQTGGVDNLLIADLLTALGAEADAKALRGEGQLIHMESKEGPWVFHLPDALPALLAKLEDEQIRGVVERWMQGEQLSFDRRARAEDVEQAVQKLRDLSRQAVTANKSLLLRVSL